MKTKGRRQSGNVQLGGAQKASPFATAAIVAAGRRERVQDAKKSPFGPAMERAAKANKIARVFKDQNTSSFIEEAMGMNPVTKKSRPTRFDAKRKRDLGL